ncbi:MAG: acyltransferase [Bacteroidales bacterium]|nr:acyltransferase [Bacteroidales bacterium]
MNSSATQRNISIDIVKGLGILCIVLWHLQGTAGGDSRFLVFCRNYVNQFHLAFFFFMSGLFFKRDEPWKSFLIKKIKRLYVPFVLANLLFLVFEFILHRITGDGQQISSYFKWAVKICLGISWTNMGGATWFLIALFRIVIMYKIIYDIFHKFNIHGLLLPTSIVICFCSLVVPHEFCISSTLYYFIFYALGDLLSSRIRQNSLIVGGYKYVAILVSTLVLVLSVTTDLTGSIAGIGVLKLMVSILVACAGIVFLIQCASLIKTKVVQNVLAYIGRNTMSILIWHFAAFKLIVIAQVLLRNAGIENILAHPCYDVSSWHCLPYFVIGVGLPLFLSLIKDRCSRKHLKLVR